MVAGVTMSDAGACPEREDDVRFERRPARPNKDRADFYMRAADLHNRRAAMLADTEWKVSLAFWAALLASGVSFISFANAASLPMTRYIAHFDWLFLLPYALAAGIFLFTFSRNQATSIIRERSRYQFCQNQAAKLLGASALIAGPGAGSTDLPPRGTRREIAETYRDGDGHCRWKLEIDPERPIDPLRDNRVWAAKALSTWSFVSGIWLASQWLAHGKVQSEVAAQAARAAAAAEAGSAAAAAALARHAPDGPALAHRAAELKAGLPPIRPWLPGRCAYLECGDGASVPRGAVDIVRALEPGSLLWLVLSIGLAFAIARAWRGGQR